MKFGKDVKGSTGAGGVAAGGGSGEQELHDKLQREAKMELQRQYAMRARRRLKADMAREAKFSATNRLMIQNQWRKIMRLAKVESLRKDIEIMSQNHERDVDRKDAVIQMLDRDLEESEEQYQMALRSHLQNIDTLIDLQDSRLLALENEFENDLRTLEDEFQAERDEIDTQQTAEKQELVDIMEAVKADEREKETDAKHEHEQLREEIRNKNLEDINVLRITLESQIEELEKHFEHAHLNYLQNTDQRTQDFKYLTTQDRTLSREIEIKILKIERLQQSQQHWRSKIHSNDRECSARNRALRTERDAIASHFKALKDRMNGFRDAEHRRLAHLTNTTHWCKGELEGKLKLARHILSTAEMCQKLETTREKVLPFNVPNSSAVQRAVEAAKEAAAEREGKAQGEDPSTIEARDDLRRLMSACGPSSEDAGANALEIDPKVQAVGSRPRAGDEELNASAMEPSGGGLMTGPLPPPPGSIQSTSRQGMQSGGGGKEETEAAGLTKEGMIEEWEYLERFNLKFNKVLMDKIAAQRRRDELRRENQQLQGVLKQFLDGISVNAEVLAAPNPLLVVNGKANLNRPPVQRTLQPTIIDGNQMVNTGRTNTTFFGF